MLEAREEAPARTVFATDPASVDVDYDNGAASRDMRGSRRSYDLAVKRLDAQEGNERRPFRFLLL